ncbi:hypothetical protein YASMINEVIRUS_770 [Yasminevirus sp. GU-2018]|uniref:Uncharacterized protein n=1 Tax=Yasminevirus sp. GU-2018 TaxID=2420051 RepID=A0A5K0U8T5_9VIRU|nr:hypothetical protein YASMINEVIRUS_770 [Yasminevirus sp. GU-2018]
MLLNIDNPVYNTIIVFSIIMLILYTTKPEVVYDNEKHEFRQFGTTDGKTLLPIYVVGILLAIILYVFFYYLSIKNKDDSSNNSTDSLQDSSHSNIYIHRPSSSTGSRSGKMSSSKSAINYSSSGMTDMTNMTNTLNTKTDDEYRYLQQQIQLQNIQNQINQLVQQQMTSQLLNQQILQTQNPNKKTDSILPNGLNV